MKSLASFPLIRAAEIGTKINPQGLLYCLPSIAGWVGGGIENSMRAKAAIFAVTNICLRISFGESHGSADPRGLKVQAIRLTNGGELEITHEEVNEMWPWSWGYPWG